MSISSSCIILISTISSRLSFNNLLGDCSKPHCKNQPLCQITEKKKTTTTTTTTTKKPNTKEPEEDGESSFGKIIAAVERFELEARKEKEELWQRVDLVEKKYKGYQQKTEKSLEDQQNKLNNIDTLLRNHERKVKSEFGQRDKSLSYLVSKKLLPYIRSLMKRMDKMDETMKKMEWEEAYDGE